MKSVLVVDDGQHLLNTLKMFSRRMSIEARFLSAQNQDEALKVLGSIDVTEIVVAPQIEGFDGFALASRVIDTSRESSISIVTNRKELVLGIAEPNSPVRFLLDPVDEDSVLKILSEQLLLDTDRRPYLDLLDVVRLFSLQKDRTAFRVFSDQGEGLLGFANGSMPYAAAGHLCGLDAFFQMALWRYSGFEPVEPTNLPPCDPNLSKSVGHILREAIQLRLAMLSGEFPAIAPLSESEWEEETGKQEQISQEPPAPKTARDKLEDWWNHISMTRSTGLRLVMGHSPDVSCGCARILSDKLSRDLDATKTWSADSGEGPKFVRIHPKGGGVLNLTVVPMTEKNSFAFESFSRSADAVLICPRKFDDSLETWKKRVPFRVKCVVTNGGDDSGEHRCTALDALVQDIE